MPEATWTNGRDFPRSQRKFNYCFFKELLESLKHSCQHSCSKETSSDLYNTKKFMCIWTQSRNTSALLKNQWEGIKHIQNQLLIKTDLSLLFTNGTWYLMRSMDPPVLWKEAMATLPHNCLEHKVFPLQKLDIKMSTLGVKHRTKIQKRCSSKSYRISGLVCIVQLS